MPATFTSGRRLLLAGAAVLPALAACASRAAPRSVESAVEEVRAAELAFAATMARRDLEGFSRHIADDAVFINGGEPLRGRAQIVGHWARFFKDPAAPFAWQPAIVEVAAAAGLGHTEGPVTVGTSVVARFHTTWQRQPDGRWLVVFDNGYRECSR